MIKTKLTIGGLLAVAAFAAHAMHNDSNGVIDTAIRRLDNPYYMGIHYAISSGHKSSFMEAINEMDAAGHALDGDDYDNLVGYAKSRGFEHIDILHDPIYQKLSASVLKDDTASFIDHLANGVYVADDHLFWLLDLARRKDSVHVRSVLLDEYQRRAAARF